MKVALVHDFLNQYGGAERVLESIHEIYPYSHIYTSLHDSTKLPLRMRNWDIRPFQLPKLPLTHFMKYYTAFYPFLFESLDLSEYDLVISSTAFFAKGIRLKPGATHISYIHTPPRYLYHYPAETGRREKWLYRPFLAVLDNFFRIWDYHAAQRPDFLIANSKQVAGRIKKFYRRDAAVIYPPVELPKKPQPRPGKRGEKYYLMVSRLLSYKRIDLAIQAANEL
ncbi:MAG: glycosyltransferase, partial [bacterium]|nr:glycosyltransferase [bacterium]